MLQYLVLIMAITTTTEFLVGCTKCLHTQVIPAMKSTSAFIKRGYSYYPVPKNALPVTQLPPMIPSGSYLNTLKKKLIIALEKLR